LPKNNNTRNGIAIIDQNSRSWREANAQKSLVYINDPIDQTSISGVINMLK